MTPARSLVDSPPALAGRPQTAPNDTWNRRLVEQVHPASWNNPIPQGRYNLVVVGGGTAGLVSAAAAAGLGAKVALIEKDLLGGDCLNIGCVPSKALLSAARAARRHRRAAEFGIRGDSPTVVDFSQVMERMRRLRSEISPHDSATRFANLGVDLYFGSARFQDANTIVVGETSLTFKRSIIATGARAAIPPIPGLDSVPYLTNETLFSLTALPPRLAIVGGGPIGTEMAQAFANFGSRVFLVEMSDRILPREASQASSIVADSLRSDGVILWLNATHLEFTPSQPDSSPITMTADVAGEPQAEVVDAVLIATGRRPNVDGLDLEFAGVQYDPQVGITVDRRLRTTNSRIYAAGDVCSQYQFTHAADFLARIAVRNALFFGRARADRLLIPHCTYTEPELAHVGLYKQQAAAAGIPVDTYQIPFSEVDRAILEGETAGLVQAHVRRGTDRIVGATIVAPHAGDLIAEFTLAIEHHIGLKKLANTIHAYPTLGEAIRRLGDQYNRTRLTPRVASLLKRYLSWVR